MAALPEEVLTPRCGCFAKVQLQGAVSRELGLCASCRREARRQLSVEVLLQVAANCSSRAAELSLEGDLVAAFGWMYEARLTKRDADQRRKAEVANA